jgi:hypothetical protein
MPVDNLPTRRLQQPLCNGLVLVAASVVALISARPFAGSWNDGSRLATVECLVDHGTLAIDRSIFVSVPPRIQQHAPAPYASGEAHLLIDGTRDKLFINGHYYSDKSPVPALLLAGVYEGLQRATGLIARERPDRFCLAMALASSGLAYVAAVWCIFCLGYSLRLPLGFRLLVTASFALTTTALPYARYVNNHILLLAVAAALMLGLTHLAAECRTGQMSRLRLASLGTLAGLGYTIDLGAGPLLAACTGLLILYRCRRPGPVAIFAVAALPWLVVHHAVNYVVGGTLGPANAVPEYFKWPGSPFTAQNITGVWNHSGIGHFLTYALALLAGKRGFLGHNLVLWLALPALVLLLRRRSAQTPEVLYAAGWAGATWLVYAVTSTNYSGECCSIRWFVPLLAPGYYLLALALRRFPWLRGDFLLLSAWGAILGAIMWHQGPWMKHMVPYFWVFQAGALLSWWGFRLRSRQLGRPLGSSHQPWPTSVKWRAAEVGSLVTSSHLGADGHHSP